MSGDQEPRSTCAVVFAGEDLFFAYLVCKCLNSCCADRGEQVWKAGIVEDRSSG
jgi:hypothetical protein